MHLRKALTVGAAVLAAALLGLTSTASATGGGGTLAYVAANGSTTPGSVAINGIFSSGTATIAGTAYTCTGGSVGGTVQPGAVNATPDLIFNVLSLTCATPLGISGVISVSTGCTVDVEFAGTNVHDGTVDTGAGPKFIRVPGTATMPVIAAPGCVRISVLNGVCTASIEGTVGAAFDEAITTIGGANYQQLFLDGTGLTFNNQSAGCIGLLNGGITLNNIKFSVKIASGTTTGIDFRLNP